MVLYSLMLSLLAAGATPAPADYFAIKVVDEQTGRGVPLVELQTTNNVSYWTDSNGLVAFYEPGLMDRKVHFTVKSHGYEFPKDGFGIPGKALIAKPGGRAELKVKRINIAERLYRMTGGGIYRDSVLLGEKVPTTQPVLNAKVFGQDSVMNAIYGGKLYWFWGDTSWPEYPLGHFEISGATSLLPSQGLDPDRGIDLNYFVGPDGFSRNMAPIGGEGPTWTVAPIVLKVDGRERMFSAYAKIKGASMETYARGMTEWNDDKQIFEKISEWPLKHPIHASGHTLLLDDGGQKYVYHLTPYPLVRVRAEVDAIKDINQYEAFTCLKEGTRLTSIPQKGSLLSLYDGEIDRDAQGHVRYGWKRNTPAVNPGEQAGLIQNGKLKPDEALLHLQDADTGKPVLAHGGTICWNEYRKRWVMIVLEFFGASMVGEVWYAEADTPVGPWVYARKIVTHDRYDFYNPKQHPYFDKDGGRIIYFEGTYTNTFSGNPVSTPRYNYNQIMYKLNLADERLVLPVPVYQPSAAEGPASLATGRAGAECKDARIAFFALDRPRAGAVPVFADRGRLIAGQSAVAAGPLFWALPADTKEPPKTAVPLYQSAEQGSPWHCTTQPSNPSEKPICYVWRTPMEAYDFAGYIGRAKPAAD